MSDDVKQSKEDKTQKTKDARIQKVKDALAKTLNDDNVELAMVVFVHKDTGEPQVWRKGHWYDASTLLNTVLSAYRAKAAMELGL